MYQKIEMSQVSFKHRRVMLFSITFVFSFIENAPVLALKIRKIFPVFAPIDLIIASATLSGLSKSAHLDLVASKKNLLKIKSLPHN
jgi:hypothetical protein